MKAVIQAGGKGTRLRPYMLVLPKPLMPVGDLPVIEMLLKWLCRNGVDEVYITIGYLGHPPDPRPVRRRQPVGHEAHLQ